MEFPVCVHAQLNITFFFNNKVSLNSFQQFQASCARKHIYLGSKRGQIPEEIKKSEFSTITGMHIHTLCPYNKVF